VRSALRTYGPAQCGSRRAGCHFAGAGWAAGRSLRPRVRSVDGHEAALPSWLKWSAQDPLHKHALQGVSSRRYARSLKPLPEGVVARGTSKSAVSQRFVYSTERKLAELMSRSLEGRHCPC
jgi:hypothetical protein